MSRAGRKRRHGRRHSNGRLAVERGETPREIAQRMPHRRGLGEAVLDQKAESALGRLFLREQITAEHWVAGSTFRRAWGVYLSTISPPRSVLMAQNGLNFCLGCQVATPPEKCRCAARKAIYEHADLKLRRAGFLPRQVVKLVALHDHACPRDWLKALCAGLDALAVHFGLTRPYNPSHCRNISC
jgi:hypothetical protein